MTLPLATPEATVPELGRAAQVRSLYPVRVRLRDGSEITIRPIGPQDAQREQAFVLALSPQTRYFRFMSTLRELPPETLYRFTHPDFDHEIALVALVGEEPAVRQIGGRALRRAGRSAYLRVRSRDRGRLAESRRAS